MLRWTFECGDVTYKSFISAGGEVEIRDFSLLAEASLMLPLDQGMNNTCEAEDVDNSGCMIDQSCCADHVDHPYHNPEMKDALLVADKASEISSSPKDLGKLKDESATEDFARCNLEISRLRWWWSTNFGHDYDPG
ncbi:hypothetical protein fugu_008124 [Takifugu bimaculatus]|uniref:Uncharacterized protein n=1 Tax=Takifugu bimaculatus TaxID=433685 RepID=A0A4Z2B0G1_9TELE|nr:hypothetical protein fugu_008124 [Takifugu bimaculatus]